MKLMNKPVVFGCLGLMCMAIAFGTTDMMWAAIYKAVTVFLLLSSLKNLEHAKSAK